MESRIQRRPTRRERSPTRQKPFGNSTKSRVSRGNDVGSVSSIDPLWTVEDVSTYLGVPVKTLYQWKWRGEGPPVRKVGRYLRYDPVAVKRWVTQAA
jgi:predicted DNA-binding transcriptional regulator AlpA